MILRDYPRAVLNGDEPACKNVELLARRTLKLLDATARPKAWLRVHEEAAADVCDFVETHLSVYDHLGNRRDDFRLAPWQRFALAYWNGLRILDPDHPAAAGRERHTRMVRRIFLLGAKGCGKSPLLVGIIAYMMLQNPEFFGAVCGSTEKQARRPFNEFKKMLVANPALRARFAFTGGRGSNPGQIRTLGVGMSGEFHTVGNHSQYMDVSGPIMDLAAAEEYHTHPTAELLSELEAGFKQHPEPTTAVCANAGASRSGPCYEEYLLHRKRLRGLEPWNDRVLPLIFELDADDVPKALAHAPLERPTDPKVYTPGAQRYWRHANPCYGITTRYDYYASELADAEQGGYAKREAYRRLFSIFGHGMSANAWLEDDAWRAVVALREETGPDGKSRIVPDVPRDAAGDEIDLTACPCWLGIDLAHRRAFSAVAITWKLPDGRLWSRIRAYLPGDDFERRVREVYRQPHMIQWAADGWIELMDGAKTDWRKLAEDLAEIDDAHDVRGVAYDDELAEYLFEALDEVAPHYERAETQQAYDYPGFVWTDHPQGGGYHKKKRRQLTIARALRTVRERMLSRPPRLAVEYNPVMNWHVDGAVIKISGNPQSGREWLLPDSKRGTPCFIDCAVAWIMSVNLADWKPEEVEDPETTVDALDALDAAFRGEKPKKRKKRPGKKKRKRDA